MSKWLPLDGFNLVYRCFYALPELTRADGFPTGALHGWVKSPWKLIDQEKPDSTLVFFDLGESAERVALHAKYKTGHKWLVRYREQGVCGLQEALRRSAGHSLSSGGVAGARD